MEAAARARWTEAMPLVVDLDDSLLRSDVAVEQLLRLAKTRPLWLPAVLVWLLTDRTGAKRRLAALAPLDAAALPYRQSVLDLIARARADGRPVLLASASHERVVRDVAGHLGLFDGFLATREVNLKGKAKLAALKERLGDTPFEYLGDSAADLAIWAKAARAVAVEPSPSVERRLSRLGVPCEVVREPRRRLPLILRQLRVQQWVKNLLVFVPVVAGHCFRQVPALAASVAAFAAFSLVASTVYIVNDLLDVHADRRHHTKRHRPFASGALSLRLGVLLCPLLLAAAACAAAPLPGEVSLLLGLYLLLNVAYSAKLKELLIVDTVLLAAFYTLRILAGGAASGAVVSQWLLAFSVFFFFGLAMVKRYTELQKGRHRDGQSGRGYVQFDKQPVLVMGISSSFLAVLILVLYLNGHDVERLYGHWQRLWLVTPIMLYWSARTWMLAYRGEIDDDPVVFALRDKVSWAVLVAMGVTMLAAL